MKRFIIQKGIIFFGLVALMGCGTATYKIYEGTRRPTEEIAIISSYNIVVHSINDYATSGYCRHTIPTRNQPTRYEATSNNMKYEVLPGEYKIVVSLCNYFSESTNKEVIVIKAQPGQQYFLQGVAKGTKWGVDIQEFQIEKKE